MTKIAKNTYLTSSSDTDDRGLFKKKAMIISFSDEDIKALDKANDFLSSTDNGTSVITSFKGDFFLLDGTKEEVLEKYDTSLSFNAAIGKLWSHFSEITDTEGLCFPEISIDSFGDILLDTSFKNVSGISMIDESINLSTLLNENMDIKSSLGVPVEENAIQKPPSP